MNKGTLKISIDNKITEQMMMENCLNMIGSGYNPILTFSFYAMEKQLEGYKTMYYLRMIEDALTGEKQK